MLRTALARRFLHFSSAARPEAMLAATSSRWQRWHAGRTCRTPPPPVAASAASAAAGDDAAAAQEALSSSEQPSTSQSIYKHPRIYDLAFGFRDFAEEAAYMIDMYKEFSRIEEGREEPRLRACLELGAGPARHALQLAQQAGCVAAAADLEPHMVLYARAQAKAAAEQLKASGGGVIPFLADMTQPLPEKLHGRIDLACILLGSLAHCLTNEQALAAFKAAAQCLRPPTRKTRGGLLLVELPHPEELFSGGYCGLETYADGWEQESPEGDVSVVVEWGREGDEFDACTQVLHRTVGLSAYEGEEGEEAELVSSVVEVVPMRQFTLQEIELLGRLAGLEVVAVHGDFSEDILLEDEGAHRMLVWLRRKESAIAEEASESLEGMIDALKATVDVMMPEELKSTKKPSKK